VPVPRQRSGIEQSDLNELDELDEVREDEPRMLYERSLELLEQGRLPEAEAGLTRFLAANPDSDLADNAQFWLAEGALRRGDVASALAGFRAVVENYPEANKIPDALLKVGSCLSTLGEPESAATVYRELLARFPETAAAETARQRLGAL
jgi:tol-pal system protein YbgF